MYTIENLRSVCKIGGDWLGRKLLKVRMTVQQTSPPFQKMTFHPSLLSHSVLILMTLAFIVIGTVAFVVAFEAGESSEGAAYTFVSQLSFALSFLCIVWLAWIHWNNKYLLNQDYISEHDGILSTKLTTSRVFYSQVRGVEIEQCIWGRIIDFGTLKIETDISNGAGTLVMKGVRQPVKIKEIIMERARHFQESGKRMS